LGVIPARTKTVPAFIVPTGRQSQLFGVAVLQVTSLAATAGGSAQAGAVSEDDPESPPASGAESAGSDEQASINEQRAKAIGRMRAA
jgi:hypothetical protein